MEFGRLRARCLRDWIVRIFFLITLRARRLLDLIPNVDVKPGQLADRIALERLSIKKVLVAVQQHPELCAPVAEMIVRDDLVSQEAQQPRQRIADNSTP